MRIKRIHNLISRPSLAGAPYVLDNTQARGSRINLQKPQILRDDEVGLRFIHSPKVITLDKQIFVWYNVLASAYHSIFAVREIYFSERQKYKRA